MTGDASPVGQRVEELQSDYGPSYRVYLTKQGRTIVVLLAGRDPRIQSREIETALRLVRDM